jgi:copper(I)-binding protein
MAGMNGMSGMKPLDSVKVPARAKIMFQPGGMHAMIFGLDSSVQPGTNITLTYVFKSGLRLQDSAVVVGAGDPAPKL